MQKKPFKQFLYGTLPWLLTRAFRPASPRLSYYKYLKDKYYTHYPYDFAEHYSDLCAEVFPDTDNGLRYVMHNGRRLYFPRALSSERIAKLYRSLLIEQDPGSPHRYTDSVSEYRGKTLLDVGAAEGLVTLDAIEEVGFAWLFECDPQWIEALRATFEPWKEKVGIVRKYVSGVTGGDFVTLDEFMKDKPKEDIFLKMDIEGAERAALAGAEQLFAQAKNLDFAICTYHRPDDCRVIPAILDRYGCRYAPREGFLYVKHRFRTCLVRGCKHPGVKNS
jgi:hypothetical protein